MFHNVTEEINNKILYYAHEIYYIIHKLDIFLSGSGAILDNYDDNMY